ncbi:MAG TPA: formate dehydrogenase subunit gamma [Paucimonas sp.]|nr:formate dehydrogenase subunit gamma [Paucimonas sp.]HJW56272.1 formate dehydrogenase subunit gamma [Burkholderiaceae bacterium]
MSTQAYFDIEVVKAIITEHQAMPGAMLPILHAIQQAIGWIPSEAVPLIANGLNLSRAEVHGVMTYYPDFRRQPVGRHVMRLCRAEACQSVGADALAAYAKTTLDCDFHQTTSDGAITLEPVYCLGQCACGPAVMVDGEVHARMTPDKLDALLQAQRGAP